LVQLPPSFVSYTLLYYIIMYMCNVYSRIQEGVIRKGVSRILYTTVYKGSIKYSKRISRNEKKEKAKIN